MSAIDSITHDKNVCQWEKQASSNWITGKAHPQSYSLQKFNISILRKWHSVLQQTLLQLHFNWNLFIKVLADFSGFIHNYVQSLNTFLVCV